jgi:hypothetical protein
MIGPEPHQPLGEAELGTEPRGEASAGLGAKDVAHHVALVWLGSRLGLSGRCSLVRFRHAHRALTLVSLALGDDLGGAALRAELKRGADRVRTIHQVGAGDLANVRPVKLGQQRAARIGSDRGNRAAARTETKAMQRKRCRFPIERQGPTSSPAKTAQSSRMRKRSKIKINAAILRRIGRRSDEGDPRWKIKFP